VLIVDAFNPLVEYALLAAHPFSALHPCGCAWSPDSLALAVGGSDGHVWVYSMQPGASGGLPTQLPSVLAALAPPAEEAGASAGSAAAAAAAPSHPWLPSLPPPLHAILGRARKTPAAAARALGDAAAWAAAKRAAEIEERRTFAVKCTPPIPVEKTFDRPQLSVQWTLEKKLAPPAATCEEDMASRLDGPITACAWNPRYLGLACAGGPRGTVALWAPGEAGEAGDAPMGGV
jgi:hypothetical protein